MSRLEDRIAAYELREGRVREFADETFSQHDRAEAEAEIWALVPGADRPQGGLGRSHWFKARLGGTRLHYEHRYTLLALGEAVSALWPRVEGDMALATAMVILRTAKSAVPGATGAKLAAAIGESLRQYDARPGSSRTPGGKLVKKRTAKSLHRPGDDDAREGKSVSFWTKLRPMLGAYVADRLVGLDPLTVDKIYREFERDINILCDDYQGKIDVARRRGTVVVTISRRQVIDACAILVLDPPSPGGPVDLGAARKQQRRKARLYHPDAHGGDVSMRVEYERVMQAYQTLADYEEQRTSGLTKKGKPDDEHTRGEQGEHHG